jgi:hypothetical protein
VIIARTSSFMMVGSKTVPRYRRSHPPEEKDGTVLRTYFRSSIPQSHGAQASLDSSCMLFLCRRTATIGPSAHPEAGKRVGGGGGLLDGQLVFGQESLFDTECILVVILYWPSLCLRHTISVNMGLPKGLKGQEKGTVPARMREDDANDRRPVGAMSWRRRRPAMDMVLGECCEDGWPKWRVTAASSSADVWGQGIRRSAISDVPSLVS